jgi:hypothetical protein
MKAKLSFHRSAALGAIAILLIPLSAGVESNDRFVRKAQIGNLPNSGIHTEPEEVRLEGLRFKANGTSLQYSSKPILDARQRNF